MNDGEKGERADSQLSYVFIVETAKCDCGHMQDHNSCHRQTEVRKRHNFAKYF